MGLVRPTSGSIVATIDGTAHQLVGMSTEDIVDLGIAIVPEGRRLFPRQTVTENLLMGAFRKAARPLIKQNLAFLPGGVPSSGGAPQATRGVNEWRRTADAGACPGSDVRTAPAADR